jgi:uridine kinase
MVVDDLQLAERLLSCLRHAKVRREYADGVQWVIAVSGAAALGKTTLCEVLQGAATSCDLTATHVELDGFMMERAQRKAADLRGYDERATDWDKLRPALANLIFRGVTTWFPRYDHSTGQRIAMDEKRPSALVILDGITSLERTVAAAFPNISVFLRSDRQTRRRLRQSVDSERGHAGLLPADDSREEEAYRVFIAPQERRADFVVSVLDHGRYHWSG